MEKLSKQEGKSLDMVNENLAALKTIFPESFSEDGVDFEVLRQLFGDAVDEGEEKYGLIWHGKKKARQIALMPSLGTLRPCPEESVDWDKTQNLFIEGDNLEVLKLLQKSYANKVKMIYIDPPYNTGKEFIYPDKFQDNLDTYLRYTGQKDGEGFNVSSNTESSGRYHTNWLNMMYPRLKLARNLLRNDGAIFISIERREIDNLIKLINEIFGEENNLGCLIWRKKEGGGMADDSFATEHEYIVVFQKSSDFEWQDEILCADKDDFRKEDEKGRYNLVKLAKWGNTARREDRPSMYFPIKNPDGNDTYPIAPDGSDGRWRVGRQKIQYLIENDLIGFQRRDEDWLPYEKVYFDPNKGKVQKLRSILYDIGGTGIGTNELTNLFGKKDVFDNPKPTTLFRSFGTHNTEGSDIILDFFAGSCTTAHAVLDLNKKDGGNRKFIMVQLPEPCEDKSEAFKAGYTTIAEIGKERIRRAAAKTKEENPEYEGDLGFKVFKLDSSNIRAWNPDQNDLEQTLIDHMEHLVEGRSEEDVLYELLLKRGVDLTVPIEEKTITGKTVYSIGYGVLFACLDTAISSEEVEDLAYGIIDWHKELEPASDTQVVFRDSAFANDIAKTNMTAILEQHGIAHVRSI